MANKLRRWDIYRALSILFWIVAFVFATLEVLGVFKDLGTAGLVLSTALALYFGFTGATGKSVAALQEDVGALRNDVRTIGVVLERMERSLGDALARIERVLIERLPGRS